MSPILIYLLYFKEQIKYLFYIYYCSTVGLSFIVSTIGLFPIIPVTYRHFFNSVGYKQKIKIVIETYSLCFIAGPIVPYLIYKLVKNN